MPSVRAFQREVVRKNPRARLWHTAFTTVYVLKNAQTAYHRDTGNLPGGMTGLMCCGNFTGAELIMSRWRIAINFQPGDVILFDAKELHATLPFEGERISGAFYCAEYQSRRGCAQEQRRDSQGYAVETFSS